ncbi:hypothetical protein D910_08437 [Dendroctonus ponderosae]
MTLFVGLHSLKRLLLHNAAISQLPQPLSGLDLDLLDLSSNNISHLQILDILNSKIFHVDLANNRIEQLVFNVSERLTGRRQEIDLESNPINCDCSNYELISFNHGAYPQLERQLKIMQPKLECANLRGTLVRQFRPRDIHCNVVANCPKECECISTPALNRLVLNCSEKQLERLPSRLEFGSMKVKLDLSGKRLESIAWVPTAVQMNSSEVYCQNTQTLLVNMRLYCPSMMMASLPICLFLLVCLATILALYFRFQLDIKVFLHANNLCLSFLENDLDGDKTYDVFISYSNKDEAFVLEHLSVHPQQGLGARPPDYGSDQLQRAGIQSDAGRSLQQLPGQRLGQDGVQGGSHTNAWRQQSGCGHLSGTGYGATGRRTEELSQDQHLCQMGRAVLLEQAQVCSASIAKPEANAMGNGWDMTLDIIWKSYKAYVPPGQKLEMSCVAAEYLRTGGVQLRPKHQDDLRRQQWE